MVPAAAILWGTSIVSAAARRLVRNHMIVMALFLALIGGNKTVNSISRLSLIPSRCGRPPYSPAKFRSCAVETVSGLSINEVTINIAASAAVTNDFSTPPSPSPESLSPPQWESEAPSGESSTPPSPSPEYLSSPPPPEFPSSPSSQPVSSPGESSTPPSPSPESLSTPPPPEFPSTPPPPLEIPSSPSSQPVSSPGYPLTRAPKQAFPSPPSSQSEPSSEKTKNKSKETISIAIPSIIIVLLLISVAIIYLRYVKPNEKREENLEPRAKSTMNAANVNDTESEDYDDSKPIKRSDKEIKRQSFAIMRPVPIRKRSTDGESSSVPSSEAAYGGRKEEAAFDIKEALPIVVSLQYNFDAIQAATRGFSADNMLGEGGFGIVYKGVLADKQEIAVKRLSLSSGQGEEEFKNEVSLLAKLQHKNLVVLRGFCFKKEERLLIYEFLSNKSLDYFLLDSNKRQQLSWTTRYKIIGGIARGLLYLHEDSRLKIVHRDLKPSNILLDADMNPKISDFGISRLVAMDESLRITKNAVGTHGYMAPEYISFGEYSVKSDVYSFGVIILEIISGKLVRSSHPPGAKENLLSIAWQHWKDGTDMELFIDPLLRDGHYITTEVVKCHNIGLLCVQQAVDRRPTMGSVVQMLNSPFLRNVEDPQHPAVSPYFPGESGLNADRRPWAQKSRPHLQDPSPLMEGKGPGQHFH